MAISYSTGETLYAGAVLDHYEQTLAHTNYIHAVVWDGEKVAAVEYRSTAYASPWGRVEVDATPDVIAAALAWFRPRWLAARIAEAEKIRAEIHVGKRVRSTTIRGKNAGAVGTVRRVTVNGFSSRDDALRVAVELDGTGELRWMDDIRLEVIDLAPLDTSELEAAAQFANPGAWRNALAR